MGEGWAKNKKGIHSREEKIRAQRVAQKKNIHTLTFQTFSQEEKKKYKEEILPKKKLGQGKYEKKAEKTTC